MRKKNDSNPSIILTSESYLLSLLFLGMGIDEEINNPPVGASYLKLQQTVALIFRIKFIHTQLQFHISLMLFDRYIFKQMHICVKIYILNLVEKT